MVDNVRDRIIMIRTSDALDVGESPQQELGIKGKKKVWDMRAGVLRLKRRLSNGMLACDR
jgi:hypothetical protein